MIRRTMTRTAWLMLLLMAVGLQARHAGAVEVTQKMLQKDATPKDGLWLESLDLTHMDQAWKEPAAGKSVVGFPITLDGKAYSHGIGTAGPSALAVDLNGAALRFAAMAGVDDETKGKGSVTFEVWVDGRCAAETKVKRGGEAPEFLTADLTGADRMVLLVSDGGDGAKGDHADWAGALLLLDPAVDARPEAIPLPQEPVMPMASGTPAEPSINHPRITGATPGRPFLFRIPATGEGPLSFAAQNLPAGLELDPATGIITGALQEAARFEVEITVKGAKGEASETLTIIGGEHQLALTPPMGWNSWNCWAIIVDDEKVRAAADQMVETGLAAHGYQYVNIDDTWEAGRDQNGLALTNKRFQDMEALTQYVHAKGLKIGIYSSPGRRTCQGYEGSYEHEEQDAQTYADWGFDYLKYDWCSYSEIAEGLTREELEKPYRVMRAALDACDRDIVYSICQYGMGNVWEWGAGVGGNLWRTTSDITDTWESISGIGFDQHGKESYAGPGHWNDPDMLVVGNVGWGTEIRPSGLTKNEQITHITLWSILAAPLLLGCDLSLMDPFTLDLLTNDEVIGVNQDVLGKQGCRRAQTPWTQIWAKPLADGSLAVGLFNLAPIQREISVEWAALGIEGPQRMRDLWQRKDLPEAKERLTLSVAGHGAKLLRLKASR